MARIEKMINEKTMDLSTYKGLASGKSLDISKLNKEIAEIEAENVILRREKRNAQGDLAVVEDSHIAARSEANTLSVYNDKLEAAKYQDEDRLKELKMETLTLEARLREAQTELDGVELLRHQKEKEVDLAREEKFRVMDSDALLLKNKRLRDEKADFEIKQRDYELQISRANQKLDDVNALIDSRDKEARSIRLSASSVEVKDLAAKEELMKIRKDNEIYSLLLDKYRSDVELQKKLKDEETLRKIQLEEEKKRLEVDALSKSLEARAAMRELEKVQDSHERLLEERSQVAAELDAVKEHSGLLESQNYKVLFNILYVVTP